MRNSSDSVANSMRGKVLHLDNAKGTFSSTLNKGQSAAAAKKCLLSDRKLSKNELKRRGCFDIEPNLTFSDCLPLSELWREYIASVVVEGLPSYALNSRLAHADMHGAYISVVRSTNPHNIGLGGIVIQETEMTFKTIGSDDRVRTFVKSKSNFEVEIGCKKFVLFGNNLCYRSAQRSKMKLKQKTTTKIL